MQKKSTLIAALLIPAMIILFAPVNLSASWYVIVSIYDIGDWNHMAAVSDMGIFADPGMDGFYDINSDPISDWSGSLNSAYNVTASGSTVDYLSLNIYFEDSYQSTAFDFELYSYLDNTMRDWTTVHYDGQGYFWGEGHDLNPVPEPCTMILLGTGLVGFAAFARRRRQ